MTRKRTLNLAAFAAGGLFSIGLMWSGMTRPEKVLGFLDLFGDWDPTLAFVMAGAVLVHGGLRLALRRERPVLAPCFYLPERRGVDGRLLAGAAIFGVGWGLVGLCPGPAVVNLAGGIPSVWIFAAAMAAGMLLHRALTGPGVGRRPSRS